MQENDFEKQVHQRMGELKILPSEAVWEQVEKRLHRKEKRRLWIIWLPLLLAGFSLGGYILLNNRFVPTISNIKLVSKHSFQSQTNVDKHVINDKSNATSKIDNTHPKLGTNENLKNKPVENATENKSNDSQPFHQKNNVINRQTPTLKDEIPYLTARHLHHLLHSASSGSRKTLIEIPGGVNTAASKDLSETVNVIRHAQNQKEESAPVIRATNQLTENNNGKELLPVTINAIPNQKNLPNTSVLSVKENRAAEIKINQAQYQNWEWGLSVQAGRSSLANGTSFNTIFGGALNYSSSSSGLSNAGTSTGIVYKQPYPLRASVGFSAGAFFKKRLGGRFSISVGLNYSSYNTTNKIGLKVDSSLSLPSVFNDNRTQTYNQYFRTGDTVSYTNKYHFIELPVILQTQITRNWKIPIYWDLGFSFSRLLTSNALYFNNSKEIYYKDNQLLNKNQLNIITGFPVKVASNKKFALQVGPELRYGLSHVMAKELTPGKHFLFLGLKVGIVLGKK